MFPAMTSPRGVAADIGEIIVDEMLAICSDIDRWREKKDAEEANARYNAIR